MICPDCIVPFVKDHRCDHVTCNWCQLQLCFDCSVNRSPVLNHGNHYHREGCRDYKPSTAVDVY